MRRVLSLGILVLVAALAGCIGDEGDAQQADADPQPAEADEAEATGGPASMTLADCRQQLGVFPLPAGEGPPVPDGFEPKPYPGDAAGRTLQATVFTTTCEGGAANATGPTSEAMLALAVTPPEEYRNGSVDAAYLLYFGITSSSDALSVYEEWGVSQFSAGNASFAIGPSTPAAEAGHGEASGPDIGLAMDTAVPGPPAEPGSTTLRFFGVGIDSGGLTGAFDRTLDGPTTLGPGNAVLDSDIPIPPEGRGHHAKGFQARLAPVPGLNLSVPDGSATPDVENATNLSAETAHTGFYGPEPTVGALPSGALFVQAYDTTIRSTDGGRDWEKVYNYSFETPTGSRPSYDPMLWVDRGTERVYWNHMRPNRAGTTPGAGPVDQNARCSAIGWSEDGGESWTRNDDACGFPVVDFQKLGGGPPGPDPNPQAGQAHPSVLYLCYQKSVQFYFGSHCAASYDGGESWPVEARISGGGLGGGRPTVADDGTVFVPTSGGLAVSSDSGLTWSFRDGPPGGWVKEVAFAPDGTMYALAVRDEVAHVARSPDRGQTWEGPWRVSPPGIDTNGYRATAVGEDGRVGVAMVGTNHSLGDPVDAPPEARWHLYMSVAEDADTNDPTFRAVRVTDDPVQVGPLCTQGACRDTGARNLLDFIDAAAAPDGTFYAVWADGCTGDCASAEDPAPEDSRDAEAAVAWLESWSLTQDASAGGSTGSQPVEPGGAGTASGEVMG